MALESEPTSLYRLAIGEAAGSLSATHSAQGATGTATIETADNDRTFAMFGALGQPLP